MRKSRIFENVDDYGLFDLFLPSCIDASHLFLCRYEVGWAFILRVDLFSPSSKGPIFTALPALEWFLQQKRGLPAFLKSRKSFSFLWFLAIFRHFCDSATPPSQHASFPHEIHVYGAEVGYGIDMSTDVWFLICLPVNEYEVNRIRCAIASDSSFLSDLAFAFSLALHLTRSNISS